MTKIKKKYTEESDETGQGAEDIERPTEKKRRRKYKRLKFLIPEEDKDKKPKTNEEKLYMYKVFLGFAAGLVGRLIGLIGWGLFLWLMIFWWVAPFPLAMRLAPYEKDKWDWKMILKTAVMAFFFLFMVTSTVVHTLIVTSGPNFVVP
ncbi:MAG: hypothetical protein RBG13Loki_2508 [Promethearchaeota archaeon CR_4]|nr:MAG: hypothetical protein RBG13Loki_2508 [Candidatus Lokiarchaeota archaeon CR_4]